MAAHPQRSRLISRNFCLLQTWVSMHRVTPDIPLSSSPVAVARKPTLGRKHRVQSSASLGAAFPDTDRESRPTMPRSAVMASTAAPTVLRRTTRASRPPVSTDTAIVVAAPAPAADNARPASPQLAPGTGINAELVGLSLPRQLDSDFYARILASEDPLKNLCAHMQL